MNVKSQAERRVHRRYPVPTSVHVEHAASERTFPARAVDASCGGMLLYVPATTPVEVGQELRLTMSDVNQPQLVRMTGQYLSAKVRRVDRHALIRTGHLAIGVEFDEPIEV